jgi:hypothetical protein
MSRVNRRFLLTNLQAQIWGVTVHRLVWDNDHGLAIILVVLYGQKFIICHDGLRSNGYFVTGASYLNGGHGYDFASSVGHPRSGSVRLLVYDSMCAYHRHQCCITGSSGQCQPCR